MDTGYWFTMFVILLIGLGLGAAGGIYYSRKNPQSEQQGANQSYLDEMQAHLQKQITELKASLLPAGENTWEETKAALLNHFKQIEGKAAETSKEILYAITAIEQAFAAKHGETTGVIQEAIAFIEKLGKDELAKVEQPTEVTKEVAPVVIPATPVIQTEVPAPAAPPVQVEPKLEVTGDTKVES